jgi:hypothetical protein
MTQESNHIAHAVAPRPLAKVIGELPGQYLKVLTRPSKETFVREMDKASWSSIWIQLLAIAIITSLIGRLDSLILPSLNTSTFLGRLNVLIIQSDVGTSASNLPFDLITQLIVVPLGFLIGTGILYVLAKAFGGQGTYLAQGYTNLLFSIPLTLITHLLVLIPSLSWFLVLVGGCYSTVLSVFSLMAVHRLSAGRAMTIVLILTAPAVPFVGWLVFTGARLH